MMYGMARGHGRSRMDKIISIVKVRMSDNHGHKHDDAVGSFSVQVQCAVCGPVEELAP